MTNNNCFYGYIDKERISRYFDEVRMLKEEILHSETEITVVGTKYYVSYFGNDRNDGLTPETPIKTINKVNNLNLKLGDGIFFKRGECFRTSVPLETKRGVTYSAYGDGLKPTIVASVNAAGIEYWEKTEYPNIYHCTIKFPTERNVGAIIFDGGKAWGIQVQKTTNNMRLKNGTVFNGLESFTDDGVPFSGIDVLVNDLEFYNVYDENNDVGDLYLYSKNENPGKRFQSIEIADKGHAIKGNGEDVTIDNIAVFGTGSHAICCGNAINMTVQYCSFSFIGGSIQFVTDSSWRNYGTRYGNAIESWESNNFKIHHCYATQVYDSCWTVQSRKNGRIIGFEGYKNISEFSNYGYELWNAEGDIKELNLHDNYTLFSGYGWSHQRPDKNGNFFFGGNNVNNNYENNKIYNNLNIFASVSSHFVAATAPSHYNFHDNVYIMESGKLLGGVLENPGGGTGKMVESKYDEVSIRKACATGFEKNSQFYYTDPKPYGNMYAVYTSQL